MDLIKEKIIEIKDKLTKTDLERKLDDATSNEHCHANLEVLDDIAEKSSNYYDFQMITKYITRKLGLEKDKWREILKTLFLIEHLIRVGSANIVDFLKDNNYKLSNLNSFSFLEKDSDKGETIREKSRSICDLIGDKKKVLEEREKYRSWKGRIGSVGSGSVSNSGSNSNRYGSSSSSSNYNTGNKNFGAVSSDTYQGSSTNWSDKGKKESKKNKEKESESSSSEDDNDKKKKKKEKIEFKKQEKNESESSEDDKKQKKQNSKQKKDVKEESESSEDENPKKNVKSNQTVKTEPVEKKLNKLSLASENNLNIKKPTGSKDKEIKQTNNNSNTLGNLLDFNDPKPVTTNINTGNNNTNAINFDDIFSNKQQSSVNNQTNNTFDVFNQFNISPQTQTNVNNQTVNNQNVFNSNNNLINFTNSTNQSNTIMNNNSLLNFNNPSNTGFNINNLNNLYQQQSYPNNQPIYNFNQNPGQMYSNPSVSYNSFNNNANFNLNNMNNMNFNNNYYSDPSLTKNQSYSYSQNNNNLNFSVSNTQKPSVSSNLKSNDFEFTDFDDGSKKNNQFQNISQKPLNKLLDPKLVNLSDLKSQQPDKNKNSFIY